MASTPPTYWPLVPSLRTTRWQGTTTGSGLVAQAVPTARTALGLPVADRLVNRRGWGWDRFTGWLGEAMADSIL